MAVLALISWYRVPRISTVSFSRVEFSSQIHSPPHHHPCPIPLLLTAFPLSACSNITINTSKCLSSESTKVRPTTWNVWFGLVGLVRGCWWCSSRSTSSTDAKRGRSGWVGINEPCRSHIIPAFHHHHHHDYRYHCYTTQQNW